MTHERVIEHFQGFHEGRLECAVWVSIADHLTHCEDCAAYYRRMSALMDEATGRGLPQLLADPALPARIRTMSARGRPAATGRSRRWLRLSFAAAVTALAVMAGVFLGNKASAEMVHADEPMMAFFYNAFSQSGFTEDLARLPEKRE